MKVEQDDFPKSEKATAGSLEGAGMWAEPVPGAGAAQVLLGADPHPLLILGLSAPGLG